MSWRTRAESRAICTSVDPQSSSCLLKAGTLLKSVPVPLYRDLQVRSLGCHKPLQHRLQVWHPACLLSPGTLPASELLHLHHGMCCTIDLRRARPEVGLFHCKALLNTAGLPSLARAKGPCVMGDALYAEGCASRRCCYDVLGRCWES